MRGFVLLLTCLAAHAEPFPDPINTEKTAGEPMPPEVAAAALQVPEGFHVSVFAAEPMVRNPIACSWDTKGRLWVAENYTFDKLPGKQLDARHRDRVVILSDGNNDGQAEKATVFSDQLTNLTSIEWGTGGLWLMCPPRLLFLPDRNRDDVPDGPAEVVLDGFTVPPANHHNFANGLRWGPDGWLYGRCGASAPGEVGLPGAPPEHRVPLRGGTWRYHPVRRVFEALNHGTTNPWGHDWDQHGELFFINTVNGHLWHGITGAHFVRPHTIDPNPHVYELIDMHADHWHFDTTGSWTKSRGGAANRFGGGHAHVGMMIYQGTNWPQQYRHKLYTINLHGQRTNQETLERHGSGYVAKHGEDLLIAGDPFFRGIELSTGPDGGVYVLDWSDTGECHENTGVHRTSGRIFKVTYGNTHAAAPGLFDQEPRHFQDTDNAWLSRLGRQALLAHPDRLRMTAPLHALLQSDKPTAQRLNALWTLHQLGVLARSDYVTLLKDPDEHLRAWAIRLLTDSLPLDDVLSQRRDTRESRKLAADLSTHLESRAKEDSSALVRLTLASALQRLPHDQRSPIAKHLVQRAEDADDHNLPLMIWYGILPLATSHPDELGMIGARSRLPKVTTFVARRLAEEVQENPAPLNELLQLSTELPLAHRHAVLSGMETAFETFHRVQEPPAWKAFQSSFGSPQGDEETWGRLVSLSVLFGNGRDLSSIRNLVTDSSKSLNTRKRALRTLIRQKPDDLRKLCTALLRIRFLNTTALEGLQLFDDPAVAEAILANYGRFHPSERPVVTATLVSRPAFARVLLRHIGNGKLPRTTLSPFHARQLQALGDEDLSRELATVWGTFNESPAERLAFVKKLRAGLSPAALDAANLPAGRNIFEAACATCHTLYGRGGKLGPDLTGGGRHDLDYLLENIVTPSAVVTADFRISLVKLKDGRSLTGMVKSRNERAVTLQTQTELQTLAAAEVVEITPLGASLMPEGLLEALTVEQRRDLLAYLMHPVQVPVEGTP